jgi:hypothetical protein
VTFCDSAKLGCGRCEHAEFRCGWAIGRRVVGR